MTNRGLKRICTSCGTKFYDFDKSPIKCPSCEATFTGEIEVKSSRRKSTIVPDTVKRDEIEAKNKESVEDVKDDKETISLDDLEEDENSDDSNDDDLSDLKGDVDVGVDSDKDD